MTIPTFSELKSSILTDLQTKLIIRFIGGKLVLNAFASVQAAKLKLLYVATSFIYENIFPNTAVSESLGGSLERFGRVKLGRDPNAATAGEYSVMVSGTIGAVISANTTFKSLETSTNPDKIFTLDDEFIFSSTTGEISLRALELGVESRLDADDELQVTAPIASVDSFCSVLSVDTIPTEAETLATYKEKVIDSYQVEPQGGSRADYVAWAQEVTGVRTSYPYVKEGDAGVVQLYIEGESASFQDGVPSQALLEAVEASLYPAKIPATVYDVEYLAVKIIPVDVEVVGLSDTSLLTAVSSAISTFLTDVRPFIDGADDVNNRNDKLYYSDIFNVVRSTIGNSATFTSVNLTVDNNSVVSFFQFIDGEIPYTRNIT